MGMKRENQRILQSRIRPDPKMYRNSSRCFRAVAPGRPKPSFPRKRKSRVSSETIKVACFGWL